MRKLFLIAAFVLAFTGIVKAENSAQSYDANIKAQQVFVGGYAYAAITKNQVVVLDVSNSTNGTTKGAYVNTTATTDSVYVLGVADEDIATGTVGRICVRGPHQVKMYSTGYSPAGKCISSSTTAGKAGLCETTSDGTASGRLGFGLSDTYDTTDTDTVWIYVRPSVHK